MALYRLRLLQEDLPGQMRDRSVMHGLQLIPSDPRSQGLRIIERMGRRARENGTWKWRPLGHQSWEYCPYQTDIRNSPPLDANGPILKMCSGSQIHARGLVWGFGAAGCLTPPRFGLF